MLQELVSYFGILASIWMLVGVYGVAKRYPNYSHKNQFCSELGASGSPTERLSPAVNNYPLALLFPILILWILVFIFSRYHLLSGGAPGIGFGIITTFGILFG